MMNFKVRLALGALFVGVFPLAASAKTLFDTLSFADSFLNGVVGLFVTLAIVVFFWGIVKYLVSAGEQKAEGLKMMFYGVIAIFVMVSIWGIIALLQNTFIGGGPNGPVDLGKPPAVTGPNANLPR